MREVGVLLVVSALEEMLVRMTRWAVAGAGAGAVETVPVNKESVKVAACCYVYATMLVRCVDLLWLKM